MPATIRAAPRRNGPAGYRQSDRDDVMNVCAWRRPRRSSAESSMLLCPEGGIDTDLARRSYRAHAGSPAAAGRRHPPSSRPSSAPRCVTALTRAVRRPATRGGPVRAVEYIAVQGAGVHAALGPQQHVELPADERRGRPELAFMTLSEVAPWSAPACGAVALHADADRAWRSGRQRLHRHQHHDDHGDVARAHAMDPARRARTRSPSRTPDDDEPRGRRRRSTTRALTSGPFAG